MPSSTISPVPRGVGTEPSDPSILQVPPSLQARLVVNAGGDMADGCNERNVENGTVRVHRGIWILKGWTRVPKTTQPITRSSRSPHD